ncbi:hypothetical protein [Flavobacterium caeni]|uniref:Uncharacterized protein n=1 Tax=Flavobacterium caeni TaxID=490189 RepID=A0A1G5D4W4_9FLAO|nr:hypothetical protein [Flavobacterium caeni]SCY09666.1 hypothetical protein SAMN02927903_00747 [Flavobacterium caeni]
MLLTSSILLGFIRLGFILLFLFYLNRKFVNSKRSVSFLEFLTTNWFRYGSATLIVVFALVQTNAYNLFNTMFLLLVIIGIDLIGIENLKHLRTYFNVHIKSTLLRFLRDVENKKSLWQWISVRSKKKKNKNKRRQNILVLVLTILIGGITFISRYFFIKYDNYSLSDAWIADLAKVIEFDNQFWFKDEVAVNGEFALVSLYGKITDVSPEIALQVISILEATLLAVLIFWLVRKLTPSKVLAPIIGAFSFALVYVLTPINVYYLLENDPTFMAMTFGIPIMVFYLRPELLRVGKLSYYLSFVLAFCAVGLIDFFTLIVLLPPFLVIGLVFSKFGSKLFNLIGMLSYVTSLGVLFVVYSVACHYIKADFWEFFHANLLSVTSYTYVPQLVLPYGQLIMYFQYMTLAGAVLILLFLLVKRENWSFTAAFFLYFNFLVFLATVHNEWIDRDMIINSLTVFLPIIFGLNAALVVRFFNLALYKLERFAPYTAFALMGGLVYASIYFQQRNIESLTESDHTPKQILDAYDKISKTYFPYSYSIVNDPATQVISLNKHFFMNYEYFLEDYAKVDSIYFKNKKDPKFLIKNPQYALTKSVLVFVLNAKSKAENNIFSQNKYLSAELEYKLDLLRQRGRKVNLFYDSEVLKVFEVVNEPGESKITELIF